ncbi:hypothetical protein BC962_1160, partial [Gillisia mitskevichiae]
MDRTLLNAKGNITSVFLVFIALFFSFSGWTQTVTTDKDDYAPGEYVIITGTGWEPGERVDFTFEETPKPETCVNSHDYFATSDANGNIYYDGFLIKDNHIGVAFVLTATGQTSGKTAVTEFTDGNVRVKTNTGFISVEATFSSTTNCNTAQGNITSGIGTSNPGTTVGVADKDERLFIRASATNSLGNQFSSWFTSESYTTPDPGKPYEICLVGKNGTMDLTANYAACNVPNITTQPTAKNITYGDADPTFSVTSSGTISGYQWQVMSTENGANWSNISGATSSSYKVVSPTVDMTGYQYRAVVSGCNTSVNSNAATLTVNKKVLTITADNQTVPYSTAVSTVIGAGSYVVTGFVNNETASVIGGSATYTTTYTATTNAGTSGVTITPVITGLITNNYSFTPVNGAVTVSKANQTITFGALPLTKMYGDGDFAPGASASSGLSVNYSSSNTSVATILSGQIHIVNAGITTITASQPGNGNYNPAISVDQSFIVGKLNIQVTADAQTKTYGDADPSLTYGFSPALVSGDSFSGTLSRTGDENVGNYAIEQGSLALSSNYILNYTGAAFDITQLTIAVTADAQTKTYGDADPLLTYGFSPALVSGDSFSGTLSRTGDENVGNYLVEQGSLALSSNYILNYTGAAFDITQLTIAVTADAQTKTYGDADPSLTYGFSPALVSGDSFSGSLSRTGDENVGNYLVEQGSLALSSNYILNYTGAAFDITQLTIAVTADAQTKTYGDADPSLT